MQRTNPDPAVLAHKIRDLLDEMYPDPAWEDHMRVCRELADAREQINTLTGELDMVSKKLTKALADNAALREEIRMIGALEAWKADHPK